MVGHPGGPGPGPPVIDTEDWYSMSTMERKPVQVGSSRAVTLPVAVVKEFKLVKGQAVELTVNPTTGAVTIRPGFRQVDGGKATARFRKVVGALLDAVTGAPEVLLGVVRDRDSVEFCYEAPIPELAGPARAWLPVRAPRPGQ